MLLNSHPRVARRTAEDLVRWWWSTSRAQADGSDDECKILGLTDGTWRGRTNGEATRSVLGSGQWMDATKAEQDDLTGMSQWLRALRLRGSQASQARWREPWLSH
ncbi:hypothetical protein L3X38_028817 [Prunus dulcis]|uniref:Uncharacterized protein n=1 Tax=Prunus dulcis TaxID=3755 RepID=A0AAD4VQH2_PRUDU|nr:hypothetical protein L3X38_028817 [Prunus dulcis]